jgi:uncharacterized protein involved in type VI secretion and phage assembly
VAVTVNSISLIINGNESKEWFITIGSKYHIDNLSIHQSLLLPSSMTFTLTRDPEESADDPRFTTCGEIIGKKVSLSLKTMSMDSNGDTGSLSFDGFIVSANGCRSHTEYQIHVEARSWDALLDDNPTCKSFENMTLADIVADITNDYSDKINPIIDARFQDIIPYCVQYNETNYQFLQRLARRYGEWLYNTGTQMVFGNLQEKDPVSLDYPSHNLPGYSVDLKVQHVAFNHVASSYNLYDASQKDGLSEMMRNYNSLSEKAFMASQEIYTKQTLQNLHSGGFAKEERADSRETILNISTKTQGRGEKAGMLTYSGTAYSSKLVIGGKLNIKDNYKNGTKKNDVPQDLILITEINHYIALDHGYSSYFVGIPDKCDYPPYSNSDLYPYAPSCRAKVKDNEDPNGLGRIRVQFDWQKELDEDMMTPWLRMAQPYAGGGKGFSFIPEIGEEVMIDFEGGNAERPFVKGTLYNGVNDVDNKWVANSNSHNQVKAIRTRNGHTIEVHDEGSDGYIRIYDNEKENYILTFSTDRKLIMLESTGNIELYAKNDIIMHAGHDIMATANHDITTSSGHDTAETAGNDMFLEAGHDQQRTAENDIYEHAGQDRTATIDRNDSLTVAENQFIKIEGNKDEQLDGKYQLTAETLRFEATDQLLLYSKTHHQKASDEMAMNAGDRIDIKAGIVKIQ